MTKAKKIYIGGWFQRTTLHLSEVYDFLKDAASPLALDPKKLQKLRGAIGVRSVTMTLGHLDSITVVSESGIEIKITEDGLIILGTAHTGAIEDDVALLTSYYEEKLSPGIGYIFSLGAPVPKELANIKTIYPYFVIFDDAERQDIDSLLEHFDQKKYIEVRKKEFEVYRGDKLYIINNLAEEIAHVENFIEEQIFIREFKTQLHRYLNLHRIIWEEIAAIKERGKIRGSEVGALKDKTESYAKTINLIEARISQMDTYIHTRESVAKHNEQLKNFISVLEFKYETLGDTLEYVKDIWDMTKNYVNSALSLFGSIQAKSTESSVKNLTVVTSMGVGATLVGLFSQKIPEFHMAGFIYFAIVAFIGWAADRIMKKVYQRRLYKIGDVKLAKDIK